MALVTVSGERVDVEIPALQPPDVADWAERHVILPALTAQPGPLRLTAPQRAILRAYADPQVQQITLMTGNQVGKSLLLLAIIGYHIAADPRSCLLVQPTIFVRNRFMEEKFVPFMDSTPAVSARVRRTERGTVSFDLIRHDRGEIHTGYSGSTSSLESVSAQVVLADEVDSYRMARDGQHPIDALHARGASFGASPKLVLMSTPIKLDGSIIAREYGNGSAAEWHVPCRHCGDRHVLAWEDVRDGVLHCPSCSRPLTEADRVAAIAEGEFVETSPNAVHKSFHLSQMYSPLVSIPGIARRLSDGSVTDRGFSTRVLGRPFQPQVLDPLAEDDLADLYHDAYEGRVTAITASVDVQKDRLEYQVVHWSRMFPRIVTHAKIHRMPGDTREIWRTLARRLRDHKPDMVFVDVGAFTEEVRAAAAKQLARLRREKRLRLVRGSTNPNYDGDQSGDLVLKQRSKTYPLDLWLGTNTAKEIIHDWLSSGGISINAAAGAVPDDFSAQLVSEELRIIVRASGAETMRWVRDPSVRNEALDCLVYNLCARNFLGPQFDRDARLAAVKAMVSAG